MPKLHSFLYVIHKATEETKSLAEQWCLKQKLKWYVIVLEPYIKKDDKEGHHLHLMFRVVNPRSPTAITEYFQQYFNKPREDIWQERLEGRFPDQVNYVSNEYAGEHRDDPKILDPSPIIYPLTGNPDEIVKKVNVKDEVIEAIQNGATFNWLLKTYPKFVFDNEPKIKKFYKIWKTSGQPNYYPASGGGPQPAEKRQK